MSFFRGATRFAISGGTFSSVGRDQINITQCSHREDRVRTIMDEYKEIPMGKVYLKRKIAESEVRKNEKGWKHLNARRTICAARIRDEDKDEEFLHVQYTGRDAAEACKLDFDTFSAVKDINYVQLFGYSNMNALPALVFHDALVPVSHILGRNNFSPILFIYFSHQALAVQGLEDTLTSEELWLDSTTGFLRKGPVVMYSNLSHRLVNLLGSSDNQDRPSLTFQSYNNIDVLFEYLNGTLSVSDIIRGIRFSNQVFSDYPNDEDAKRILSSLPGTVYHRNSREVIARYPNREKWYFEFLGGVFIIPDALQQCTLEMNDGSVRFTLKPSGSMEGLGSFGLCYNLQPEDSLIDFTESCLSQAHHIFEQLEIGEDDWREYCSSPRFWLAFTRVEEHEAPRVCLDLPKKPPIYFFIRPVPRPSDDEDKWDSWMTRPKYYWSFDPSGVEEVSEHERLNLGLPAFTTKIGVWYARWDRDAYNVVQIIHRSQGFDPASTELATSLGLTILDVAGRKSRFEEVHDDEPYTNSDVDDTITDKPICEDLDVLVEDVTEDDDVVLYPRSNLTSRF